MQHLNFSKIIFVLLISLIGCTSFGQISVTPNKANATYNSGESMTFNVTSNTGGQVTWILKYDNFAPIISSGSMNISPNQTQTIPYTSSAAGVIICEVTQGNNQALAAAAFSPFEIQPFEDEPADFDAFWNGQKSLLADVPIDPVVTFYQNNTYSTSYRIQLNNVDNRKVFGYIVIPNGSGPFPATLDLPPYGTIANLAVPNVDLAEQGGVIAVSIVIHNAPADQVDPNAYLPDNYADKASSYYRWAILGGIRAIDFIFTRNEFNGTDLGVVGASQGAGLATIVSGLDSRVKLLAISNPVLSQNAGLKYNRAGGFPNFIQNSRSSVGTIAHEEATVDATRYYDAMFHIRRYENPLYANLSYEDVVTPAETGFATINQSSGKKILLHSLELGHTHPFEYWVKRQDFIRRVFPSTLTTHPFPFSSNDQGYWIDAGDDLIIAGTTTGLTASILKNESNNPSFILGWKKISGPGNVSFSNINDYSTSATFSSNGTYELEFSGRDEAQLTVDKKYFTLSDRVIITVGDSGNNNTLPTVTISTPTVDVGSSFVVTADFSENITGLTLSDISLSNATVTDLSGSGSNYTFTVNPITEGTITVVIPSFKVVDNQGAGNENPSNTLTLTYTAPGGGGGNGNCDDPTNLALNKLATQESTQSNADASRAVDGNTDGNFWGSNSVSLTNWVDNAWWEVDLGEISEIKEINIWNRSDCCQSILANYHVLVSDVPFTSTNLDETISQGGVSDFLQDGIAATPSTVEINRTGRYVRIQLGGQGFLALAEIEVFGCDNGNIGGGGGGTGGGGTGDCSASTNIAPLGFTTQISTQFSGTSDRAVDGNTEGGFWNPGQSVSLTEWNVNAWWEIDLGEIANIDEVKIWNRTDCCTNILKNYYVLISDVPFVSDDLSSTLDQANIFSELQEEEAGLPSSVPVNRTGRYLRIQLKGQGFLALAEVEIMGCFPPAGIGPNNPSTSFSQLDVLEFNAAAINHEVQLTWATNTENINDLFVIEKSTDGENFVSIIEVASKTDEFGFHFYQEKDQIPSAGKTFYRLLQIDKNGFEGYSEIYEVVFDLNLKVFTIFPNPTTEHLFVNLKPFLEKDIQIQIFDAQGVLRLEKNVEYSQEILHRIELENFVNGLYLITVKVANQKMITRPFVVSSPY
jgi:cephalosporin-C deacetylase